MTGGRVVRGYGPVDEVCPYCGDSYMAFEDDGQERLLVRCWCGATARVERSEPEIMPSHSPEDSRP